MFVQLAIENAVWKLLVANDLFNIFAQTLIFKHFVNSKRYCVSFFTLISFSWRIYIINTTVFWKNTAYGANRPNVAQKV